MRALIAMSGGVDSSTAAFLLQQEGCDCEGVNLTLYRNADIGLACHKSCCTQRDADDAADAVRYTPGQRRGLRLPMGERVYVIRKDMAANTVTVGPESALYSSALTAGG